MVDTQANPWALESGLPDEADVWVTKSRFGTRADYQNGEALLLVWDVESPDADFDNGIIWSVGSKWETDRQGLVLSHTSGAARGIIKTSNYGRMIDRITVELKEDLSAFGSPMEAKTWEGLGFHLRREVIEFPGGGQTEDGPPARIERLMPVAFLGTSAERGKPAAPAKSRSRATAGAATAPAPTDDITDKLKVMVGAMDAAAFQRAALGMEGVSDNPELLNSVLDESDDGFYEQNQG